jgi:hypothetical protein
VHEDAPDTGDDVPAEHAVQVVEPADDEYLPTGHDAQLLIDLSAPVALYVPAGHGVQDVDCALE